MIVCSGLWLLRFSAGIYFWLHWVFVTLHGLSLAAASRGYSIADVGFSLPRPLFAAQSTSTWPAGFYSCSTWSQALQHTGLAPRKHVGFSQTRDGTSEPRTGRQILNHPPSGDGNPLQYSCLENVMDRGPWWATVHRSQRVGHD